MGEAANIIRNLVTYRRNGRLDREGLKALQLQKFRAMVRHAMDNTEYYARTYQGVDPDKVVPRDLPVVTKADLLAHYEEFLSDPTLERDEMEAFVTDPDNIGRKYKGEYILFHTSGTTGQTTTMVYDTEAFGHIKAVGMVRGFDRPASPWTALKAAVNPNKAKFAIVVITGGLYPAVTNFHYMPKATKVFFEIRLFSLFTPMDELVEQLNEYQPWFLIGYPSVIQALAYEQKAGRLDILDGPPRRSVATLSEPLFPQVRKLVKEVWGLPVVDTYGTGECLPLARGCSQHGNLHINEDLALAEVVDDDYQPVPDGAQGRSVLVSNLFNKAMPFLRYQVSDMVTIDPEPCPCGSPLARIESVQGRTEEMLWLTDADGNRELLHPYLFVVAMFRVPAVREYQVEQTAGAALHIRVDPGDTPGFDLDEVERAVDGEFEKARLRTKVAIDYEINTVGPDPKTGKVRRILPLPA